MQNPLKRKPKPYELERQRLLEQLATHPPQSDDYEKVMKRLNELDRILNRTSEFRKTLIPTLGPIGAVGGIYLLQQFAGVLVPKAMDAYATRGQQKSNKELE